MLDDVSLTSDLGGILAWRHVNEPVDVFMFFSDNFQGLQVEVGLIHSILQVGAIRFKCLVPKWILSFFDANADSADSLHKNDSPLRFP